MCPEIETLSAYYDGELESSQKPLIEKHVASCPECQNLLADMDRLSDVLHAEKEPDFAMAQSRVWDNIMDVVEHEEYVKQVKPAPFWHRKFQISFPAAAALAAAFIAMFSIGIISFIMGRSTTTSPSSPELNITDASSAILNDDIFDSSSIEFDIPAISNFVHAGEPLLIKEVDFRTRNGKH